MNSDLIDKLLEHRRDDYLCSCGCPAGRTKCPRGP